jgi:hypothetical protein
MQEHAPSCSPITSIHCQQTGCRFIQLAEIGIWMKVQADFLPNVRSSPKYRPSLPQDANSSTERLQQATTWHMAQIALTKIAES